MEGKSYDLYTSLICPTHEKTKSYVRFATIRREEIRQDVNFILQLLLSCPFKLMVNHHSPLVCLFVHNGSNHFSLFRIAKYSNNLLIEFYIPDSLTKTSFYKL